MGAPADKSDGPAPAPAAGPPPPPQAAYPPPAPQAAYPPPQGYPAQYQAQQPQYPPQYSYPQYSPYTQPPPQGYPPQQPHQPKPQGAFGVQGGGAGYDPEAAAAAAAAGSFAEQAVRTAFARKVFLLVFLQLAFTTGTAAIFMFVKPVNDYVAGESGRWLFIVSWILALVMMVSLSCSTTLRRRHPYNLIALFAFTFVMSVLVGSVVAYGDVQIVLIAFGTTFGMVTGLTFLACVMKFDITRRAHVLGAAAMMFMIALLITILVGFFYANKWWFLVISCIGALLFSAFLVYDVQRVIGGKSQEISPDEYVFASVQIYMDVINIFLMVLTITNIASN